MAFVAAVVIIERAVAEHRDELQAMEPDREVLQLEQRGKALDAAWREGTSWELRSVGIAPKALITCSAAMLTLACWMSTLLPCFHSDFGVADSISGKLGGSALNIVLAPYGWIVIGLFASGWTLRPLYLRWAKAQARGLIADTESASCQEAPVADMSSGSAVQLSNQRGSNGEIDLDKWSAHRHHDAKPPASLTWSAITEEDGMEC